MNTTILIFEDDVYIAEEIAARIRLANLGTPIIAHTVEGCLTALDNHSFDLAILDIEVPGNSEAGFQIARQLSDTPFLFFSGHNHKRFAAYKLGPQAFLKKGFDENTMNSIELALLRRLDENDSHFKEEKHYFTPGTIFIYHQGSHHKVKLSDILFVKLENSCLTVQLEQMNYLVWVTLDHFLEQAGSESFLRIHRSHAINLDHLRRFSVEEVQVGNHSLAVSKNGTQLINQAVLKIQSKRK